MKVKGVVTRGEVNEGIIQKRLQDVIKVYERIYGPLRECPGEASIYPAGQHSHGCKTFYCLSGHHHIGEYMFENGSHTHTITSGKKAKS